MAVCKNMATPLIFILVFTVTPTREQNSVVQQDERKSAFVNGDFIIGVLFPVHHQPNQSGEYSALKCGEIREIYGIQRVEVAFQTLDKINSDSSLLPNVRLGMEIRDECWYAPIALQQSIELIRDAIAPASPNADICVAPVSSSGGGRGYGVSGGNGNDSDTKRPKKAPRGPLIGIVGPGSSSVALQVQNLLQLFHIPQVGYSTTSKDLSDKRRFNYFLRVVPSDYYQAQAIMDIVRYHGWMYVSAVYTGENYGTAGMQAFRELAEQTDVCIARENSVLSNAANETFDEVVLNLLKDDNARVVVCFCEGFTVRGLLGAFKRLNRTNHFLLIGSDGWADRADVTKDYAEQAWGSMSMRIHSPYVVDFNEYYWKLRPFANTRNPWFNEFWEWRFSCSLNSSDSTQRKPCTKEEEMHDNEYRQDSKLSFVIKAIYSLAYGLHAMHQDVCGPFAVGVCPLMKPFNGSLFKNYLMNVSFTYGDGEVVEFDYRGDPPGRYDILNFQKSNGSFDYLQVGAWNNGSLEWTVPIQFGAKNQTVRSVCSEPCPPGHYKNVQKGGKDKRCCWVCVPCNEYEIIQGQVCVRCPNGRKPNPTKTECDALPIKFVKWTDTEAIVALFFAAMGFLTTAFAATVFLRHNNTPVVKSSTRELSYIILAGMTLSHSSTFFIIAEPTVITCALSRVLPGISFGMIYAALLTKTNRIARILAGSKKRFPTRKPLFMSATAQVVITCFLIAIEGFITVGMLKYQNPNRVVTYPDPSRAVLECNTTTEGVIVPLAFAFVLILFCTVYAVKTRNVPENFNEAKFIGFAMYTTCVIWIAFFPIYFGSDTKVITMCMCVTLSATVTWVFIFAPKLFIILLQPERNNRALFTTSKSIRCHIGSRVASVPSDKSSMNSWRESSCGVKAPIHVNSAPEQRTLSCQTGAELLEVLLNPLTLMKACSPSHAITPSITERDCCSADHCHLKDITIILPKPAA